jgi:hypothetical protein
MSGFSTCVACDQPMRWAITDNDKFIPLDLDPSENGNIELTDEILVTDKGALHRARVHGESAQLKFAVEVAHGDRYLSHFVTCTDPERFRRRIKNTAAL